MKTISAATAPAAYTNSFAATLTIAAILGIAAGATTAKAWNQKDAERMTRDEQCHCAQD
jgi:uncharacterized protein involved in exopolysaccharide biosynthesis